jgi:hypothetical protein
MAEVYQQPDQPPEAGTVQPVPVNPSPARTPYWRKPLFGKLAAVLCLIAAAGIDYVLVNIPVGEVSGEFPANVKARAETVTFDNPGLVEGGPFSFEYRPRTEKEKVLVDAYFDAAQLSEQTLQNLKSFQISAPTSVGPITYLTSTIQDQGCTTKVEVKPVSPPTSVQFSQTSTDSLQGYRSLGAGFQGTDTEVTLTSQGAIENTLSPCKVELSVGDWKQVTAGFFPIKVRVPAGQLFRLRWQNLTEKSNTWENNSSALKLVQFEPSATDDEFTADAIKVSTIHSRNPSPPRLEAHGERNAPLTIESFAINTDQLEIKASGKGRVRRNGSTVTKTNFLQTLYNNPVLSALFTTGNLALIGWAGRMFFGRKKQAGA